MERISNKSPCLDCCSDRQIGNPYVWQSDCYRCEKLTNWKAKVINRLADIEDILGDDYDLDRLKEMVEADKENRVISKNDLMGVVRLIADESVEEYWKIIEEETGIKRERLIHLAKADKEERCVVLPCKDWLEIVFGEQEVFYGIDMEYIEHPIREISVDSSSRCTWYDGWKNVVIKGYDENGFDWDFEPEEIGETVFLTREEAEAALEKMKGGNE